MFTRCLPSFHHQGVQAGLSWGLQHSVPAACGSTCRAGCRRGSPKIAVQSCASFNPGLLVRCLDLGADVFWGSGFKGREKRRGWMAHGAAPQTVCQGRTLLKVAPKVTAVNHEVSHSSRASRARASLCRAESISKHNRTPKRGSTSTPKHTQPYRVPLSSLWGSTSSPEHPHPCAGRMRCPGADSPQPQNGPWAAIGSTSPAPSPPHKDPQLWGHSSPR